MRELSVARPHDLMSRFSINFFRDQKGQVGGTYTLCFRRLPDAALPRGTDSLTGFVLVLAVSLFWHPFLSPINLSRSSVAGAAIFF